MSKKIHSTMNDSTLDALREEMTKALAPIFARYGFEGFAGSCKASQAGATFRVEIIDPVGSAEVTPLLGLSPEAIGKTYDFPVPGDEDSGSTFKATVIGVARNPSKNGLVFRREDGTYGALHPNGVRAFVGMGILPAGEGGMAFGVGIPAFGGDGQAVIFGGGDMPPEMVDSLFKAISGDEGMQLPQPVRDAILADLEKKRAGRDGKPKPAAGSVDELMAKLNRKG